MKNEVLKLDDLNASNLPELQGFKETQEALVKQYPFIEITDNASYETAKKHRTTLLKGRTSLEAQDKLIASKLSNFRKDVKTIIDELVSITLPHETKQQEEVKRFEEIKENERLEKQRIEELRIKTIKDKISEMETSSYEIINLWDVKVLENAENSIFSGMDTDFDFEEYDVLFEQAKERVQKFCEDKINSLTEKENQRIANEKLLKEKKEADAKLKSIEDQQAKEKKEREEKEKAEKDKVFEVRKNRLAEIGLVLNILDVFTHPVYELKNRLNYEKENIFNCDVIDFENLLTDAKESIKESVVREAKQQKEKEDADKLEKENKAKADKENKSRIKRLSQDKAIYKQILIDKLSVFPIVFEAEQTEVKDFSIDASNRVTDLYNQLLIELHNL